MNINEHLFALFTQHVDTRHTAEVFAHANELVIRIVKRQLISAFKHYKRVYTHSDTHLSDTSLEAYNHFKVKHTLFSHSQSERLIQLTLEKTLFFLFLRKLFRFYAANKNDV